MEESDRRPIVPMNSDQVWMFDVAAGAYGHDLLGLIALWVWTLGFLVIGIVFGRPLSLVVAVLSLCVAVPWTVARIRSARAWREDEPNA